MSYSSGILNHLLVRARELISSEGNVMNFDLRCFPLDESTIIETCYPFYFSVVYYQISYACPYTLHTCSMYVLYLFRNYKIFHFYYIFNSGTYM